MLSSIILNSPTGVSTVMDRPTSRIIRARAYLLLQEVESKLKAELEAGLDKCVSETNSFMRPVEEATAAVVERLKVAERRRAELAEELEGLKQRAASVE